VELAEALGLSVKAIEKIVRQLKDANMIRRAGGKKFGRWEVG
jgi:DNA-binding Lrp family transcriptional regulator